MTDLSTQTHFVSCTTTPRRKLGLWKEFVTFLFKPRRSATLDQSFGNAHLLRDIGMEREANTRPMTALDRFL